VKKIMVIEDDSDVSSVLADMLKSYGYEAYIFASGENALAVIEEILPDVLIMDLMMPQISGFEICKTLRSRSTMHNLPMIAITGYDSVDNRRKIFDAGIDDYLPKPFDLKMLMKKIQDLIPG
jgi:DNA-binding response OmpR family regulator